MRKVKKLNSILCVVYIVRHCKWENTTSNFTEVLGGGGSWSPYHSHLLVGDCCLRALICVAWFKHVLLHCSLRILSCPRQLA